MKHQPTRARLLKQLFKGDGLPTIFRRPDHANPLVKCEHCSSHVAEIEGDELVIRSRHYGQAHVTRLKLVALAEMAAIS